MSDQPKRKKRMAGKGRRPRRARRTVADISYGSVSDLDLRTLVVLSVGEWWELGDREHPPQAVARWIEGADLRQLRGILLDVLVRWHELSRH